MSKRLVILLIIILNTSIVLAYDLSDFPDFFRQNSKFDGILVVGDSINEKDVRSLANILLIFIPETSNEPTPLMIKRKETGSAKIASEVINISSQNIITVGGPCANNITAKIMDLPTTWPECAKEFENDTGKVILYNKWNMTQLVVAGYSAEDTSKAAKVLANFNKFNLSGYELNVSGNANDLSIRRILTRKDMKYCGKNEDCIKAPAEPCGCWGGGKSISINKEFYNEYIKSYEGGACVGVMSDHISCFAKPICVNNQCDFDYKNYSVCEGLYEYYNQCYTQFAITNNNESICEKIILSHDGSPIKLRINECKNAVKK